MTRIPDRIRDCAVYIFPDKKSAEEGKQTGATGFLVGVPSADFKGSYFAYAVTNRHVILQCGPNPVMRLNSEPAGLSFIETEKDNWSLHDGGDDLAVHPLPQLAPFFKTNLVPEELFLTQEEVSKFDIGPGDDVFFIGRFVNHEGKLQNRPALRFGNISMMPWEPIKQKETGFNQESFVVEGRATGGYSGAPVFVYKPEWVHAPRAGFPMKDEAWLLGIEWGHLTTRGRVEDKGGKPHSEDWGVEANSGMIGVVPAWKLRELLDQEELVKGREEGEKRLKEWADATDALGDHLKASREKKGHE